MTEWSYNIYVLARRDDMAFQLMRMEHHILKDTRTELGLTQQQIADKAKIQLRQYQRFESGERNLSSSSFNIACRVIEALELNVSDYFHGEYVLGDKTEINMQEIPNNKT